jgi:ribonuclease HI
VVKLNSDGAICEAEGRAGSGGVARDALGFRGAWAKVYAGVRDPFMAETLALRDVIVFAHARGFQRVVFETDSQELVRCWLARSKERSLVAPILEEINTVKDNFISFSLVFQGREGNKVAHACARLACARNVTQEWLGVCPDFLLDSILADCNSMLSS